MLNKSNQNTENDSPKTAVNLVPKDSISEKKITIKY